MPNANPLIIDRFTFGDTVTVIPAHDLPTLYFRVPAGMGGNPENSPMIRGFDCYDKASAATEAGAFGTFRNGDGCGVDRGVSWYAREHAPAAPEAAPVAPAASGQTWPCGTPMHLGDSFTGIHGTPGVVVEISDDGRTFRADMRGRITRLRSSHPGHSRRVLTHSAAPDTTRVPVNPVESDPDMPFPVCAPRPARVTASALANEIRSPGGVARDLTAEVADFDDDDRRIVIDALAESLSREMLRRWRDAFPGTSDGIEIRPGRRYLKILRGGSVAAFVDRTTGDVFKPATHRAPARHARGNVLSATQGREALDGHGFVRYLR